MLDVFAADDRRTLGEAISRLRLEGERFTVVLPVSTGERGRRWLRVCGFPVRETGAELSRIVGFFEDVTEHKLAEDVLRDSEAKLRTCSTIPRISSSPSTARPTSCSPTGPCRIRSAVQVRSDRN
jgi:PAS domain-containing protein